jgi:cysteine rich repeat protein
MNMIRKSIVVAIVTSAATFFATAAFAADGILDKAKAGCQEELTKYCKEVTPGNGRILACLSAYEDKLSSRCEYALYQASEELEAFAVAFKHVATECKADLLSKCGDVQVGQGRGAQCLKKNEATLAPGCKQAINDTNMQVK